MELDNNLLVKFIIGEPEAAEIEQIMEWSNRNKGNETMFSNLLRLRISERFISYNDPDRIESGLRKINHKIKKSSFRYRLPKILKYAAILILVFGLSYGGGLYWKNSASYRYITVNEDAGIKKLSLNDGTILWLKAGSSLGIPASYSAKNRKVKVKGEAYFDVKKNTRSPFLVKTGNMNIMVHGTSFNVKTNGGDNTVETILASGKVAIQNKKGRNILEMLPGEKVTFNTVLNNYVVEAVDVNTSTSWHLDQLRFESVTLREIVNKISIIYDVNVNLESKNLTERKFRCVINRDESLTEVLEILKYLAQFEYRIEGDEVFISE